MECVIAVLICPRQAWRPSEVKAELQKKNKNFTPPRFFSYLPIPCFPLRQRVLNEWCEEATTTTKKSTRQSFACKALAQQKNFPKRHCEEKGG